jgi:hypothetical protein
MARGEYVLNIGDDNVVLTRFSDGKVANAWLGSPDPAMAQEELGEALAEDPKGRLSVIVDTLDQSSKEEEIPRVGILDRRKVLARHINMAFPGANLRGARLVAETAKKTLIYEFASVPLDGRIPGWMDFVASLPNEKGNVHAIASENVNILSALAPKDAPVEPGQNHWRHLIGVNVTGGLRQIIEKNGRLSLTRLTQAPPPETLPADFADMIIRDFKATITYIRRLGYQVGEPLDLVVLTTAANKAVLENLDWDGARSVTVYTPYEAGIVLGLGSIGREDQAYCDVLHAAWFASRRKSVLPLTRAAALGDTRDDIRELAYVAAPYAAGLLLAGVIGWGGWTGYELNGLNEQNQIFDSQLTQAQAALTREHEALGGLPYEVNRVRNVIDVARTLDEGKVDIVPWLQNVSTALESDAVVLGLKFEPAKGAAGAKPGGAKPPADAFSLDVDMRLAKVISTADEAVQTARRIEQRLNQSFGKSYRVAMTTTPVGAQASKALTGGFTGAQSGEVATASEGAPSQEAFFAGFHIERAAP